MKQNNKKQCPTCEDFDVYDRGDKISEFAQDLKRNEPLQEPTISVYQCRKCDEIFKLIDREVCPNCNSDNIKIDGPFAEKKPEGEPASKMKDCKHYLYCWDCQHNWEKNEE